MGLDQVGQDDVDLLFAEYEAQAAADRAHTEQKSRQMKQKLQKSMKELRQEGLEAPIARDNKGFQMLAAMGYQQGQGLGKGQAGRSAPVPVQMKAGRHGLGVQENKKRRQQQIEQQQEERGSKRTRMQQDMQVEHKATSAVRAANRRAEGQLLQARQVCETLDRRKGLESSEMWPQQLPAPGTESPRGDERGNIDTDADEEVQQEASWEDWPVQAKLAMVLDHLRQNYHYCIFCGCQYSDAEDMSTNCPGLQDEDH